ncbi:hypothetical protein RBU61_08515 [Tissierella sp. MB52-C2]|uniref:hypothetical protein n=1 Tax=Tissierella sp. MB52-C2 TaxID=3070999 RepID=UPI00280B5AD6|nr:hypothetical protein [Tissierella sp. MB52-C2]WMM26708.1 hypothetical protein RBU61_08515 [Tissierella sp. MB52-C2]
MKCIEKIDIAEYPLCDADFWINICYLLERERVFKCFNKILFADAVWHELKGKSFSNKEKFKNAYVEYINEINKNRAYNLVLSEDVFIDSKQRLLIEKLLVEHNIRYDKRNKCYEKGQKDLGEKVSIIYATVLSLKILLSDDNGSKEFRSKSNIRKRIGRQVDVFSTGSFLRRAGLEENEVGKLLDKLYDGEKLLETKNIKDETKKESFLDAKNRLISSGKL